MYVKDVSWEVFLGDRDKKEKGRNPRHEDGKKNGKKKILKNRRHAGGDVREVALFLFALPLILGQSVPAVL